jgi:hypothetical protein
MEVAALKIATKLAKIASEMGPDAFGAMRKRIAPSLKDKSESCFEKRSNARIEQLIAHMNIEKPPNARERKPSASWIGSFLRSLKGGQAHRWSWRLAASNLIRLRTSRIE